MDAVYCGPRQPSPTRVPEPEVIPQLRFSHLMLASLTSEVSVVCTATLTMMSLCHSLSTAADGNVRARVEVVDLSRYYIGSSY